MQAVAPEQPKRRKRTVAEVLANPESPNLAGALGELAQAKRDEAEAARAEKDPSQWTEADWAACARAGEPAELRRLAYLGYSERLSEYILDLVAMWEGSAADVPAAPISDEIGNVDAPGELPPALTAATVMPRLIPLSKLVLADKNVRRGGKADLEQLAADILAHGVLQNLVGTVVDGSFGAGEQVQIVAGGRRLRALELLKRQGKIDGDHLVPVQIVPGYASREASLAENFQRLPMSAGEEVEAFGWLADLEGLDAAAIAARFGLTVQHVKQRLRLAGLAAPVLAALKDRKITLEVAQAFASVPDAARQEAVWKELKDNSWAIGSPNEVRRQMAGAAKQADSVEARFVGEAAYLAAGAVIITNPPYDEGRVLMHALIAHFRAIAAESWLLLEGTWPFTEYAAPHLDGCTDIVPAGRMKIFEGSPHSGVKPFAWCRFVRAGGQAPRFWPVGAVPDG